MAIYRISDIQDCLNQLSNDGFLYTDPIIVDGDEEFPESLSFSGLNPDIEVGGYDVDSIPNVSNHELTNYTISPDDNCYDLVFTYKEISTIHHALRNALEFFKECEKDSSCSKEDLQEIKASSVSCRNLLAKVTNFLKQIHIL